MRAFLVVYSLVVAVLMVGWWGLDLRNGVLRRPDRRLAEIGLHLTAEFATAALLVVGSVSLAMGGPPTLALVALGMLLYTVVQSPGYFLARRELAPAAMFGVLLVLTLSAIVAAFAV
jgi:hypothetical protein